MRKLEEPPKKHQRQQTAKRLKNRRRGAEKHSPQPAGRGVAVRELEGKVLMGARVGVIKNVIKLICHATLLSSFTLPRASIFMEIQELM